MAPEDTIVAPATARGESAIAVVRVSGPQAEELATAFCRRGTPASRRMWHGHFHGRDGALIDDVVFGFFPAPNSYTGEHVMEVSCHGNPLIVRKIIEDFCMRGCRPAEPGEFTKRAYLNGRMDLTAAEAVIDVIRARDDRALVAAQRQLQGHLGRRIDAMVDRTLRVCAGIEAYIDFPEEDIPPYDRAAHLQAIAELVAEMRRLAATQRHNDLVRNGIKVVLVGAPNVGKSSVFNRLVSYDRAIVSEEPGTTRDFLEEHVDLGDVSIRLFDTAGIRDAEGRVERAGVTRTLEQARQAEIVLWVTDATSPAPSFADGPQLELPGPPGMVLLNKCDLPQAGGANSVPPAEADAEMRISALTGAGFDQLRERLRQKAAEILATDSDDEMVAVNARHAVALTKAADAAGRAGDLLGREQPFELVASELRVVVAALGEIVGHLDHEAVLDRLFASFCIGK